MVVDEVPTETDPIETAATVNVMVDPVEAMVKGREQATAEEEMVAETTDTEATTTRTGLQRHDFAHEIKQSGGVLKPN